MLWRKDGTGFSVEYTAAPMRRDGEIAGAVIVFRDITEIKMAEQAVREANNIINRSPAVAFVWENTEGWPVTSGTPPPVILPKFKDFLRRCYGKRCASLLEYWYCSATLAGG